MRETYFERAIFISWYCSKRDCAFCYLSSRKALQDPIKDRRSLASIFAEAIICKACGWKIEFLSGGCETFDDEELLFILKNIYEITKQKQWLNIGILTERQLRLFKPYLEGICGTVECITPKLRDDICPSKPLEDIEEMFKICDRVGLKKTATMIIGLGETIDDFIFLKNFIQKNGLDKITFYRLKPQKGTIFEGKKGPDTDYYVEWIKKTRNEFPNIEIVVGSWLTHLDEIHLLLESGADNITKFPSVRQFNTKYAGKIEEEIKKANRKFVGTLTKVPEKGFENASDMLSLDDDLKEKIRKSLSEYLNRMKKNKG